MRSAGPLTTYICGASCLLDDGAAQYTALRSWVDEQPVDPDGNSKLVWIDRCCIDRDDVTLSLSCLPVFISGCRTFLAIVGPTFPTRLWYADGRHRTYLLCTRLWVCTNEHSYVRAAPFVCDIGRCTVELFVFFRMGGRKENFDLRLALPLDGNRHETYESIRKALIKYDASKARCFQNVDRQRLLGSIESSFGSTGPFNRLLRSIFAEKMLERVSVND